LHFFELSFLNLLRMPPPSFLATFQAMFTRDIPIRLCAVFEERLAALEHAEVRCCYRLWNVGYFGRMYGAFAFWRSRFMFAGRFRRHYWAYLITSLKKFGVEISFVPLNARRFMA
jgi:hypothetical protein